MSFMAGFAEGFTNAREKRRAREDDLFKIHFNQFTDGLEQRRKTQQEESQAARQASLLAQSQHVNNPDAAGELYNLILDIGWDDTQRIVEEGRFVPNPNHKPTPPEERTISQAMRRASAGPTPRNPLADFGYGAGTQGRLTRRLDEATGGQFSAPDTYQSPHERQSIDATTPRAYMIAEAPEEFKMGTLQENMWLSRHAEDEATRAAARSKVNAILEADTRRSEAEMLGQTGGVATYRFQDEEGNWNITRANRRSTVDGTEVITEGTSGRPIDPRQAGWVQVTPDENKARSETRMTIGEALEVRDNFNPNMMNMYSNAGRMLKLVEDDPNILAQYVGRGVVTISELQKETQTAFDLIQRALQDQNYEEAERVVKQHYNSTMEEVSESLSNGELNDFAGRVKVFEAQMILFAYQVARSNEEGGRINISDSDFQRAYESVMVKVSPQAFQNNMAEFLTQTVTKAGNMHDSAMYGGVVEAALRNFEESWGYPLEPEFTHPRELLGKSDDLNVQKAFELYTRYNTSGPEQGSQTSSSTPNQRATDLYNRARQNPEASFEINGQSLTGQQIIEMYEEQFNGVQ